MKKLKPRVSSQKSVPNEKIQPIQSTKQPIGELMGADYLPPSTIGCGMSSHLEKRKG
jgi:hypothetical protein